MLDARAGRHARQRWGHYSCQRSTALDQRRVICFAFLQSLLELGDVELALRDVLVDRREHVINDVPVMWRGDGICGKMCVEIELRRDLVGSSHYRLQRRKILLHIVLYSGIFRKSDLTVSDVASSLSDHGKTLT